MLTRGTQTFTWNAENRLQYVDDGGVRIATYTYDRDGNRAKKQENGETTIYIGKYYEKNTTTGTETFYYFLGNKLVAYLVESTASSDMRYVHQDHLGSTSVITDDTGAAVYEASYGPWGNVSASTGTADMDRLYTGQRFDAATGLYYYNARYYDPTLARFISPDTIVPGVGDPQAWNRYAYVLGNPLRYTDPSGYCIVPVYDDFGEFYGDYDVTGDGDDPLNCTRDEYDAFSFEFSKFWANLVKQREYWEFHTQVSDILYWLSGQGRGGDLSLFFGPDHVVGGGLGCVAVGPRNFSCPPDPEPEPARPDVVDQVIGGALVVLGRGVQALGVTEIALGCGVVVTCVPAVWTGVCMLNAGAFAIEAGREIRRTGGYAYSPSYGIQNAFCDVR